MRWDVRPFGVPLFTLAFLVCISLAVTGCQPSPDARSSHQTAPTPKPSAETHQGAPSPHTVATLPVPNTARSRYINPAFGYTVQYPSQWKLTVSTDKSRVQVFIVQDKSVPQGMGFEIWCASNPSGMNAQQWRQSEVPPNSGEEAVGYVTLSSDAQAYKVVGHATGTYDVFTSVHGGNACDLTEYETDIANTKIIETSINSFTWN